MSATALPSRQRPPKASQLTSFRLFPDQLERLDSIAAESRGRKNRSFLLREAVDELIARYESSAS